MGTLTRAEIIAAARLEAVVTLVDGPSDGGDAARATGDRMLGAALDVLDAAGWDATEIAGPAPLEVIAAL